MTTVEETTQTPVPEGHVRLTIDGREVIAPKGELIIRTAEREGIEIPRFCDHPLLDPAAACRQCLVEVEMNGRAMPKPQPACAITISDGMVVHTQHGSEVARKAQEGVMELLLINHPLDCPICDKGGECPLQNQALRHGRAESRFRDQKRTFTKPIEVSKQVLLDRERCVLCQRCTRFSAEIAGDPFIELLERGAHQQIGTAKTADAEGWGAVTPQGQPYQSYFSGNAIQICPVGALTSAAYRFRSRPFDLVSAPSVCEHCSSGCAERTDFRRGKVMRKLAGEDPEVNEEWICDKGRFAFRYVTADDRITRPLVRENGKLREASWTEALRIAADRLAEARDNGGVGVLPGGRLTVEDAYAYAKFARISLHTNDIDFRARPHSAEELDFLTTNVLGTTPEDGVTFTGLERANTVLCVALEPEEEAPAVFLRLRKAARKAGTKVVHIGQFSTPAVDKTFGTLLACIPGEETNAVLGLREHAADVYAQLGEGGVILLGERAAEVPGLLSTVAGLARETGAQLAWIPRRAGERGALEAGALPTLLPGGRRVDDTEARAEVAAAWGLEALPELAGKDASAILTAAANGKLHGLVLGGVDPDDLPNPELAREALARAEFVVSLELRRTAVTEYADVVLPVAAAVEKSGTYLNWEGRPRPFDIAIENTGILSDCRVLDTLAVEMDTDLFTQTPQAALADLDRLGTVEPPVAQPGWTIEFEGEGPPKSPLRHGKARLATWHRLLDNGSLQDNEPHLAQTARETVVKLSTATAQGIGVGAGDPVVVSTHQGRIELPAEIADLPDGVVWLPANSGPSTVRASLGVGHGDLVDVRAGGGE
ncbi:NADH-quinone oxidoreductase subunit G [Sciscionella marina]|uniref:NADH-quinone oxidoreductase subunit G n=1 Tax=Sciscionella marina TaxID=508770 RepID=UPI00035F7076|nr:NADH-quinone oxidoreductase subunit G [Sciscionella marina]